MSSNFSISDWTAIAEHHRQHLTPAGPLDAHHRAQIAQAEEQIATLNATVHKAEMRQRALALADNDTSKRKKSLFKWVIEKRGAIENVCSLLEEVRYYIVHELAHDPDSLSPLTPAIIQAQIGAPHSAQWRDFQLRVIKKLKDQGSFGPGENNEMSDFEDTAGGCDEIVHEAAFAVLEGK
jgi:hypothetical protein